MKLMSLIQTGKFEFITREASFFLDGCTLTVRYEINNSGICTTNDHVLIYSGNNTEQKHGVGTLFTKQVAKSMMGFH